MMFEYRPKSMIEMEWQSDVQILGVINRLKEYRRKPEYQEIACDLEVAANVLDYLIRMRDDLK
jgi:hypothetical protein